MGLKLSNNATSTLASSVSTVATTLSVQSGDAGLFPSLGANDWFPLTVVDTNGNREVMKATGRAGEVITVERAQEGTSAIAFQAGDRVDIRATSAALMATTQAALSDAADKVAPVDGDVFAYLDSAANFILKKLTWANIKSIFDARYYLATEGTALEATVDEKADASSLGALASKDQVGTGDIKADEVRAELETEVKTRVTDNEPEFYNPGDDDWKKFSSTTGTPVGSAVPWFSDVAPNSFWVIVKDVGQVFSRGTFPQLLDAYAPERTVVITNGSAVVTGIGSVNGFATGMAVEGAGIPAGATVLSVDAADQVTLSTAATANGTTCRVFPYGNGDGLTTANFPDFAGRNLRGWDPGATVNPDMGGTLGTQEDATQRITGSADQPYSGRAPHAPSRYEGAFSGEDGVHVGAEGSAGTNVIINFDSGNSPGAKVSDTETRGKSLIAIWIVKVADGVDDPAILTASAVIQDLADVVSKASGNEAEIVKMFGVGQTWKDMTTLRVKDVAYQNTSDKPIEIYVTIFGSGSTLSTTRGSLLVSADNVTFIDRFITSGGMSGGGFGIVVPPGWYYMFSGTNFQYWTELS